MKKGVIQFNLAIFLVFIICFGLIIFVSYSASAVSTSATASVNVAEACTMSSTLTSPHTATIPPNTNQTDIGITTIKVTCNDASGYSIYAVGYTGNEIGGTNSTKLVGVANSTSTISTGTATSGNTSNWSMKLSTSGSSYVATLDNSFGSYHTVPAEYTKVAHYNSATDLSTGSTLTTTYAAYINGTQSADTYAGKVKYTMVHPTSVTPVVPLSESDCPRYSICYAPNSNDIEGSMSSLGTIAASAIAGKQSSVSTNSTAELRAYNYSRRGYGFAGWSTSYDTDANNSNSVIYGPQATISTNPNDDEGVDVSAHGLILYPVWVESQGTMQAFSSLDCNSMNINQITARTDIRDNNTYAIAKLADGKCWMMENLRLEYHANITPNNTQSNNGQFGGVFVGLAKSEESNFDNYGIANSLYSKDGSSGPNIISGSNNAYRFPRYNNSNINRSLTPSYNGNGSDTHYQWFAYGNYYTWAAAVASTNNHETIDSSIDNMSICPSGWRLPKGGSKNNMSAGISDYYNLALASGLNTPEGYESDTYPSWSNTTGGVFASKLFRKFPNNLLYSGEIIEAGISGRGSNGDYWTSTTYENGYTSYSLVIHSYSVFPSTASSGNRRAGFSVRCLIGS